MSGALEQEAIHTLARLLVEQKDMPRGWAIAPDPRDGGQRNEPTQWVVDERAGRISDELAAAIRDTQRRDAATP